MQKAYGEELQMAAHKKEMDLGLQKAAKNDDYNRMQKNIQLKATLEQIEKNHHIEK